MYFSPKNNSTGTSAKRLTLIVQLANRIDRVTNMDSFWWIISAVYLCSTTIPSIQARKYPRTVVDGLTAFIISLKTSLFDSFETQHPLLGDPRSVSIIAEAVSQGAAQKTAREKSCALTY